VCVLSVRVKIRHTLTNCISETGVLTAKYSLWAALDDVDVQQDQSTRPSLIIQ